MNEIIKNLTIANFENLKASYETSKRLFWNAENNRLFHPGEYGGYRERLVHRMLRPFVPGKFDIRSGFVINSANEISTQCDVVIFDRDRTPIIDGFNEQSFYPVETVAVVGEVKSDINSAAELNGYLEKLAEVKKLRDDIRFPKPYFRAFNGEFNLVSFPYDNVFTFLICNKMNFNLDRNPIAYECEPRYKHNLILSLHDGLFTYDSNDLPNMAVPFLGEEVFQQRIVRPTENALPEYLAMFVSSITAGLDFTTLLGIDMAYYLTDNVIEGSQQ